MPGTTTHGYILYKALEGLGEPPKEGDKTVMQELAASSIAAKNLATQNKPASLENDPKGATVFWTRFVLFRNGGERPVCG